MQQPPYNQNPYQQPQYQRNPYGYNQGPSANAFDIILGVLLCIFSVFVMFFGVMLIIGGAVVSGAGAQATSASSNPMFAQFGSLGAGVLAMVGVIVTVLYLILFLGGIGMCRFKKWAFLTVGILMLIVLGLAAYGYASNPSSMGVGNWVVAGIEVFYIIYCFARFPSAN